MARMGKGLRRCSLNRSCGEEIAGTVGEAAVKRAFTAALCLPSRCMHNGGGVYLQAWKASEPWCGLNAQPVKRCINVWHNCFSCSDKVQCCQKPEKITVLSNTWSPPQSPVVTILLLPNSLLTADSVRKVGLSLLCMG